MLVLATIPWMVDRVENNHAISEAQVPWRDAEQAFRGRSLVFLEASGPYLLHLNPFSDNTPDLDGRVLYATDRGAENLDLIAARPGRNVYYERTNLTTEETLTNFDLPVPTITVTRMHVHRAPTMALRVRVTNPSDDPVVVAYMRVGQYFEQRTLSTTATKGDVFETEWRVAAPATVAPGDGVIGLDAPLRTVVVGARWGPTPDRASPTNHVLQRFWYRVEGTSVEMLTPGRMFTRSRRGDELSEKRVSALPALSIHVAAAATT